MTDYPGVDPDGLTPGGLQVAGRVNAGSLAIAGALVVPSAVSYGVWNCNIGLSMGDGTNAFLPLDNEQVTSPDISYIASNTDLTVNNAGLYFVIVDAYSNVGWAAGNLKVSPTVTGATSAGVVAGVLGHEGSDTGGPFGIALYQFTAGSKVRLVAFNNTGVTDTIFGDIIICRLV